MSEVLVGVTGIVVLDRHLYLLGEQMEIPGQERQFLFALLLLGPLVPSQQTA